MWNMRGLIACLDTLYHVVTSEGIDYDVTIVLETLAFNEWALMPFGERGYS